MLIREAALSKTHHSKLTEQMNLHSGSAILQSEETHHVTPRLWFITMTNCHWSWFMTHTLASSGIHTGYSRSTIKRMVRSNWFFLSFEALSIGTQVCIPRLHWNDTFSDFLTTLVWRNSKSSNIPFKWLHLCKVSLGVKLLWFVGNGHRPRIFFILLEVINQNIQNSTCQLTFHLATRQTCQ